MNNDEMTKTQQIEEMAIMDCHSVPRGTSCADCPFASVLRCDSYRMATALVNANYHRIADDEVIVKKSMLIDAAKAFAELGNLYANGFVTLAKHHETIKQVAKDTARKILQVSWDKRLSLFDLESAIGALLVKYDIELEDDDE